LQHTLSYCVKLKQFPQIYAVPGSLLRGTYCLRLCLGVWRGEEGKALGGGKYREIEKSFTYFGKSVFLENEKLMFMIHIFLILRIL